MVRRLGGKVAVVTGASRGIGASIAKHLAAEGASVVVNYRSGRTDAEGVVAQITESGGEAIAVKANVTIQSEVEGLFAATAAAYGDLNVVVNNAGMYKAGRLSTITEEHFHSQFTLNVLGLILVSKEAVKYFGPAGGSIINISSIVSRLTPPGSAVYNATKAAVDALTLTFAKELAPLKIRVNSVNPGLIETEGLRSTGFIAYLRTTAARGSLGCLGQPRDVAPAVAFLASEDADSISGETIGLANMARGR
jgi:3-oxoacyl-[acyl-carrier protein] reductase